MLSSSPINDIPVQSPTNTINDNTVEDSFDSWNNANIQTITTNKFGFGDGADTEDYDNQWNENFDEDFQPFGSKKKTTKVAPAIPSTSAKAVNATVPKKGLVLGAGNGSLSKLASIEPSVDENPNGWDSFDIDDSKDFDKNTTTVKSKTNSIKASPVPVVAIEKTKVSNTSGWDVDFNGEDSWTSNNNIANNYIENGSPEEIPVLPPKLDPEETIGWNATIDDNDNEDENESKLSKAEVAQKKREERKRKQEERNQKKNHLLQM